MELEDLKKVWEAYDERLNKSLYINEEILKKINLTHAKNEMRAPLIMEIINIITIFLFFLFCIVQSPKVDGDPLYLGSLVILISIFFFYLFASVKKAHLLVKIDYYNQPILEVQEILLHFERVYLKSKKYELIIAPLFFVSFIFYGTKIVHNVEIVNYPFVFLRAFIICMVIAYPLGLWIYKYLYEKRLIRTQQFLNEIKEFEEDLK